MSRHDPRHNVPHRQRGVAALTIALIIVVVATIVTIGVTQIGVGEQKNMANEVRNKQAGTIADMSLDRAANYLRQNLRKVRATTGDGWMVPGSVKWAVCDPDGDGTDPEDIAPPCGDGTTNVFNQNWTYYPNVPNLTPDAGTLTGTSATHYVARAATPGAAAPGTSTYYIVSEGRSVDQTGLALIKRAYTIRPLVGRSPDAPLIAAGTTNIKGSMNIVANPNGGGPGVPLSVWSGDDTDWIGTASKQTCHVTEYLSTNAADFVETDATGYSLVRCPDCICPPTDPSRQISNKNIEGLDILDDEGANPQVGVNPNSSYFPDDLFEYIFGVPESDYQSIKDQATIINDCGTLGENSSGLYWIVGNCSIPANTKVGTLEAPVALVMENGTFKMASNSEFLGLIFLFAQGAGGGVSVDITGSPTLYGALISNKNLDLGAGSYNARYEKQVLQNLANVASTLTDVPGSWKDYR